MKLDEILSTAKDTISVKRVFGEPIEREGLTVIPVAVVGGGGGGGSGQDEKGDGGEGGGFGMGGRPAGAYVIKNGELSWRPAVDPNRIVLAVAAVAVAYLLTRPRVLRAQAKVASA
jgi:uncharacterized spore protein YtfJ